MIIFYYNKVQQDHTRLINHLYSSYRGEKLLEPTSNFGRNARLNSKSKAIVFAGIIRGEGLIYKWCVANNKRFFYLDHAYLERGYKPRSPGSEWFRITDSEFVWNKYKKESSARWERFFKSKYEIQPWRSNNGQNILVLPPSLATKYIFTNAEIWTDQILRKIKEVTDRKIIVREKPNQPVINDRNHVTDRVSYQHAYNVYEELKNTHCVVTYNSAVPVEATIMGIPCYSSLQGSAFPINIDINHIENPNEPNREVWLHQLVHHQYNTDEMINGEVWRLLLGESRII